MTIERGDENIFKQNDDLSIFSINQERAGGNDWLQQIHQPLKTPLFLAAVIISASQAHAAAVFWSFQNNAAGTGGTGGGPNVGFTSNAGFAGTPSVIQFAPGSPGAVASFGGGGAGSNGGVLTGASATPYTYGGTTWEGSGTGATGGYSMVWGTSQGSATGLSALANIGFIVTLNTVGLTDLTMRFDVRSATGSSTLAVPPNSFAAIEYNIGGGWVGTGLESGLSWPATSGTFFSARSIDFSAINGIENQTSVQLRFTFANGSTPTGDVTQNIRIDNLLINAVPEPASVSLAGLATIGFLIRRRRA